jgi:hypothetical protein
MDQVFQLRKRVEKLDPYLNEGKIGKGKTVIEFLVMCHLMMSHEFEACSNF